MKTLSITLLLAFACFVSRGATVTYESGSGVLLYPTNLWRANSNEIVAAISGAFPGTGSGNASTNANQTWPAGYTNTAHGSWVFDGPVTTSDLIINSATFSGIWGFPNGAPGGTNADQTRTILGLVPDVDIQTFRLPLLQLYVALAANGDMPYRNASGIITNTPSTSFGRSNLNVVDASAGRTLLGVVAASGGAFTGDISVPTEAYGAGWSGSAEVPTKGDLYTQIQSILSGGFISSVDTNDLQVNTGRLSIASSATVGTGRLVRESSVTAGGITNTVQIDIYTNTAGATWTKPAGAKLVEIFCIGGGGGGGSGRRGTNAHAGGGGGGGGGNLFMWTFSAAELGATETVVVGTKDRKSTRLNSSHLKLSRMPSSA